MAWYVVKTKARQESRAVTHLENQDLVVYCPWLYRKNGQREALFTGYLFVNLQSFAQSYACIRSTRGVQAVVRFGDWWATVDDELINFLSQKETEHTNEPLFLPNQPVVFKDGPFKGMEAIYQCANGDERAMVLLTLINRQQSVRVEERFLKAI